MATTGDQHRFSALVRTTLYQNRDVRFTPNSGHQLPSFGCPLSAGTGRLIASHVSVDEDSRGSWPKHPSTVTDNPVARANGITGAAQRQPSSFQVAAVRFDKKASDRQVATRLPWA